MRTVTFTLYGYSHDPDYKEALSIARDLLSDDENGQCMQCSIVLVKSSYNWLDDSPPTFTFDFEATEE